MRSAIGLFLSAVLFTGSLVNARADEQRAVLTIRVNTVTKQDATVTLRDGDAFVSRGDLEAAGLKGFDFGGTGKATDPVSLLSLKPALTFHVDDVALELDITVSPEHLGGTVVNFGPHQDITLEKPVKSAFLNYSLSTSDSTGAALAGEFGTRIGSGVFTSTISAAGNRQYNSSITNWIADSPQSDRRLTIGDVVSATGDLGGSVAIAGVGFQRYFGLNPNVVKTGLPQINGNALTPSTADIYVNGVLYRHEILPPGQFTFQNLPVGQGPNTTAVVVTDAFGRQQTYSSYFYGADTMLAKGISDFNYSFGVLHSEFGQQTGHGPAAAARYSEGLSNYVTGGGRFEASESVVSGGPAFSFRLPGGILVTEAAASRTGQIGGSGAVISYQHVDPHIGASIAATFQSAHYSSLALTPDDDRPLSNIQFAVSREIGPHAAVSFSYFTQHDRDLGMQHIVQLSHTVQLSQNTQLQVSENLTSGRNQKQFGFQTALNFVPSHGLGSSLSTSTSDGHTSATLQVQRALDPQTPSFGYTASATSSSGGFAGFASGNYRGQYGNYSFTVANGAGATSTSLNVAGGLVFIGGQMAPTQSVTDGYALVDTGVPHVRVMSNNVLIGRTDRRGYLLVSQLGSYMNNNVTLVSSDLPLDYAVDAPTRTVAPEYRSGEIVRFGLSRVRPVTGQLLVHIGGADVVPAYGILSLDSGSRVLRSDIGEGGEFYFDRLAAGAHSATIEFHGGQCTFNLIVPETAQAFIKLGTVVCKNGVRT